MKAETIEKLLFFIFGICPWLFLASNMLSDFETMHKLFITFVYLIGGLILLGVTAFVAEKIKEGGGTFVFVIFSIAFLIYGLVNGFHLSPEDGWRVIGGSTR